MDLRSRVQTLIAIRVVVGTLLLGSAILIQLSRPGAFPVDPFFFLIGLTYALSVVYRATLRCVDERRWLIDVPLGIDALLGSAFIHATGGISSSTASTSGEPTRLVTRWPSAVRNFVERNPIFSTTPTLSLN